MPSIQEMKRIADARTKGNWIFKRQNGFHAYIHTQDDYVIPSPDKDTFPCNMLNDDAEFIAMAANNWDKLMAVVDAVEKVSYEGKKPDWWDALNNAYKELEKE